MYHPSQNASAAFSILQQVPPPIEESKRKRRASFEDAGFSPPTFREKKKKSLPTGNPSSVPTTVEVTPPIFEPVALILSVEISILVTKAELVPSSLMKFVKLLQRESS